MNRLRVLTWHVHGNYLLYLSRANVEFILPVKQDGSAGYGGRGSTFPFPGHVREVPVEQVRDLEFDCVLFQTRQNYELDQHQILSDRQQRLPTIYLEHDPPRQHPTDTRHWFTKSDGLLVHVTPFNALMWDSGATPTRIIEHGVYLPDGVQYSGELDRGIVVINHLRTRGRLLGADVFGTVRAMIPLDLVGMDAESMGGLGEVGPMELAAFESRYRFFFNPIRWTSLGLAVIEAMTLGMPIVGLATTEIATAIENGVSGYVDTKLERLVEVMRSLLNDPEEARRLGEGARRYALERFSIDRFVSDWEETFRLVTGRAGSGRTLVGSAGNSSGGATL